MNECFFQQEGVGLSEDEVVEFDGVFGRNTWQFLVPPRSSLVSSVLQVVALGITAAAVVYCNRPRAIADLLNVVSMGV